MDENSEKLDQSAGVERMDWAKPEVVCVRAGEAEAQNAVTFDGTVGTS